jgi:hypothetical protein
LGAGGFEYLKHLLKTRRSNNLPVLDISNIRTLNVNLEKYSDIVVAHALIRGTEKLETLDYDGMYKISLRVIPGLNAISSPTMLVDDLTGGFMGLAASTNTSSLSTLRSLRLSLIIDDDTQNPLRGLCEELGAFVGPNVIEEISLNVHIDTGCQCKIGDECGRLDAVLANGFPNLCQVSLHITIWALSNSDGIALQENLNKLPEENFPRLSKNSIVMFDFLTKVET